METCLCIVQIGIKQQYGESPDTYNSSTVKARTHIGIRYCELMCGEGGSGISGRPVSSQEPARRAIPFFGQF